MFGLSFIAPLFLAGTATAAIPIIIHLIHRRKARPIPFSTLMFLRLSNERVVRRKRLREMLLLLLRCAFLVLLALAFAGPVMRGNVSGPSPSVHAVIVLDDSYSMQCVHEAQSSFDRAREAGAAIVEAMPRASEVAVLSSSGLAIWEIPKLSPNLLQVKRAIASAAPSARASTMPSALARAAAILDASEWPNRELYVITDLQRRAWPEGDDSPSGFEGMDVAVVDCGASTLENIAVADLSASHETTAGVAELKFTTLLRNAGPAARDVGVGLRFGPTPELRSVETVSVPPGGSARAILRETIPDDEWLTGCVEAAPDALAIDNTRYFAVEAQGRVPVLLVGAAGPMSDDTIFLRAALEVPGSPYRVFAVSTVDLPGIKLDEYAVIIAGQMPDLDVPNADALRRFVEAGGGLVLFLGRAVAIGDYNALFASRDDAPPLVPARLGRVVETPDEDRVGWENVDLEHPVFEIFAGAMANELRFVRTQTFVTLQGLDGGGTPPDLRVLVEYTNGEPAVVEGHCGSGKAMLFTTACDGKWSNLPLRASFLPVLHRTVAYLAKSDSAPTDTRLVGQPITLVLAGRTDAVAVEIVSPDGRRHGIESVFDGTRNQARFDATDLPGLYEIEADAEISVPQIVALNVDPSESDLERMPEAKLAAYFPGAQFRVTAGTERIGTETLRRHEGVKLWSSILAFLVAVVLLESILASLFTPRRGPDAVKPRFQEWSGVATRGENEGGRQ